MLTPRLEIRAPTPGSRFQFFTVPGYTGSGPEHWQTLWERDDPSFARIEQRDWDRPDAAEWPAAIEAAVRGAAKAVVLVAHSCGVTAVAHWAKRYAPEIAGAFLVAPPDPERVDLEQARFLARGPAAAECIRDPVVVPVMVMMRLLLLVLALPLFADPRVIEGAKRQVGVTRGYDGSYRRIPYPNGDVPRETGVCTDVIVRAYRHAGVDLQVLVHQDMKAHFSSYPKHWGLRRPDRNIDHRRVPNLATFFTRRGAKLPVTRRGADYRPGDVVTWRLSSGVPHIGLVSDVRVRNTDRYLVVHNIGGGAQIEDVLFAYAVTGHYRWSGG